MCLSKGKNLAMSPKRIIITVNTMEKKIGFCGVVCIECKAYLATQHNSNVERKKVAQEWSKQYQKEIKPEDIKCDGCFSDGKRLIGYCHVCEIRKCGRQKNIENCAYCNEYACEKLSHFFTMAPDAKKTLDTIRNAI